MKQRLELSIIYFFVLGSVSISSMKFVSQTVQSVFFAIGMAVLFIFGVMNIYKYIQKTADNK